MRPPLSDSDLDRLERELGAPLPADYRALLLSYPPDLAAICRSEHLDDEPRGILGRTEELRSWDALHEGGSTLPPGCIGIGGNGCGDVYFLHPDHPGTVQIFLHESLTFEEDAPTLLAYVAKLRRLTLWWDLQDEITGDEPPALVRDLGFGDEDDGGEPFFDARAYFPEGSDEGPPDPPVRRRSSRSEERRHREGLLGDAGTLFDRVLRFGEDGVPENPAEARHRVLEYLRDRLDPDYVVEPPFAPWEVEGLR